MRGKALAAYMLGGVAAWVYLPSLIASTPFPQDTPQNIYINVEIISSGNTDYSANKGKISYLLKDKIRTSHPSYTSRVFIVGSSLEEYKNSYYIKYTINCGKDGVCAAYFDVIYNGARLYVDVPVIMFSEEEINKLEEDKTINQDVKVMVSVLNIK